MSNKKISELEAAELPTSSDIIPIVNVGENKTLVLNSLQPDDNWTDDKIGLITHYSDTITIDQNGNLRRLPHKIILSAFIHLAAATNPEEDFSEAKAIEREINCTLLEKIPVQKDALYPNIERMSLLMFCDVWISVFRNVYHVTRTYSEDTGDGHSNYYLWLENGIRIEMDAQANMSITIPEDLEL